jgi:hypothetical protein
MEKKISGKASLSGWILPTRVHNHNHHHWRMGNGTMEDSDFGKLIFELHELLGYLPCTMHDKSLEIFA